MAPILPDGPKVRQRTNGPVERMVRWDHPTTSPDCGFPYTLKGSLLWPLTPRDAS
jgi:hypothetical protein